MHTDCFTLGSTVAVKTMHDDLIEGQVMAFDLNTKLLVLSELKKPAILILLFLADFEDYIAKQALIKAHMHLLQHQKNAIIVKLQFLYFCRNQFRRTKTQQRLHRESSLLQRHKC